MSDSKTNSHGTFAPLLRSVLAGVMTTGLFSSEASAAESAAIAAAAAGDVAKLSAAINNGITLSNAVDEVRSYFVRQRYNHTAVTDLQFGHSAVYRAVQRQSTDCIDLLLKAKCDLNVTGCSRAPLLQAVELRSLRIVKLLLDNGACPDCSDPAECTPLMIAAQNGCIEIMKVLLAAGASPFLRDVSQLNALGHAITGAHMSAIKLLLPHGTMALNNASQAEYALGVAEAAARHRRDGASQEILDFLTERAATPSEAAVCAAAGQMKEDVPQQDGKQCDEDAEIVSKGTHQLPADIGEGLYTAGAAAQPHK